eukprot:scaffold2044_cov206-Cylindrotheca_fusiformis.AAC.5
MKPLYTGDGQQMTLRLHHCHPLALHEYFTPKSYEHPYNNSGGHTPSANAQQLFKLVGAGASS